MSEEEEAADTMMRCASCGITAGDDVKLKDCSACKIVKYCGVECQKKHRKEHKKECKKRAAELRDKILFKQPESSHLGDCPICCLPHSLTEKPSLSSCCSKRICNGCLYANLKRESEGGIEFKCLFCRSELSLSLSEDPHEVKRDLTKRVEANDLVALYEVGARRYGEGDYLSALECFSKAVELGNDAGSHFFLSLMYRFGRGGVEKDEKKELYHLEEAAIGGDADARHNLGCVENDRGRLDRAMKHWVIATNMGNDESLEALKKFYREGLFSKKDLASALRAHQAAVDETKSTLREEAEKLIAMGMRKI